MNKLLLGDFKNYQAKEARQYIRPASDFIDDARELLEKGVHLTGDTLPWEKTKDKFRFREGEVTVWTGLRSNGKSMIMGQVALWLTNQSSVLIASMEMEGRKTIARMLRQGYGSPKPSATFYDEFQERTNDRLWIYDQTDEVTQQDMLNMVDWAAEMQGIKHIMIDSLMACGVNQEDGEDQKQFFFKLTTRAKKYRIHIHIVAHSRKEPIGVSNFFPDIGDVSGSAKIGDLASNCLIVHLNKKKKRDLDDGKMVSYDEPDGFLRVAKQRDHDFSGTFGFWYHANSNQWTEEYSDTPMKW